MTLNITITLKGAFCNNQRFVPLIVHPNTSTAMLVLQAFWASCEGFGSVFLVVFTNL